MKIIETERLIIRELEENDYKDLFEFASDSEVTKFLHYKTYENLDKAKNRIKQLRDNYKLGGYNNEYAVELKSEKKVIGNINISSYNSKAGGSVHLGYTLNRNYQGKGFATETVKTILQYIKKQGFAKRIVATHDLENYKSGNVLKNSGFTLEGIMRKEGENNYHSRYDVALYSILQEEI